MKISLAELVALVIGLCCATVAAYVLVRVLLLEHKLKHESKGNEKN